MSRKNRTARRRRIALGLGATGGGLLAAAFMPMGIALADTTGSVVDVVGNTGNFPYDDEIVPDPFADLTNNTGTTALAVDTQLNNYNPFVAAQFDYAIDNNQPFTFDGVSATVPASFNPATGDLDPFEDAAGVSSGNALQYDYALSQLAANPLSGITTADISNLDAIVDGTGTVTPPGTTDTEPDPFLDAVQALHATPTAGQISAANLADAELAAQNPTYAGDLDTVVDNAVANGTLSTTSTGGSATDADAFTDAFTNAGVPASSATLSGGAFDAALGGVAQQVDPLVDTLGTVPAADNDPAFDFISIFDPNAFFASTNAPNDAIGAFLAPFATMDDTFLQSIGLAVPLDQFVDLFSGAGAGSVGDILSGVPFGL